MHSHFPRLFAALAAGWRPVMVASALMGLAACSGGNNPVDAPIVTTPTLPPVITPPVTPPVDPATAARIEIVQTGLLFTATGQTRALSARVLAADGTVLALPVTWSSSDAADIAVNADGLAKAESSSGSSQIVASVGAVRSAPLLAVVTRVATGTVLVSDEQIVGGVVETNPDAAPSLENTYTVVVSGITAPAVGTLMVGTGSAPVAGRIVSTREVAGGIEVTLKLASVPELFPGLEINQRFDLTQQAAIIPESVSASYTVLREGNQYTFTPRPESAIVGKSGAGPEGSRQLFQGCEGTVNGVGLGDGAAPPFVFEPQPVFSVTIAPALDVLYTEARGLERFVVTADPVVAIDGTVKATAAFEGKIGCKAELLIFTIPAGGALSVVISGLVPVGVGFELAGKITVAQLKLGLNSRTSAKAALGLDCQGPCSLVNEFTDFVSTNTPTVDVPGLDDFRVKPELSAFGYVEAAIGNRFFRSLQFKAFEIKAGPKLEGEFAPPATQIAATDFKSSYKLSLVINAGFGDDIEKVLNILGVVKVGDEVLELAKELGVSPTGVLTVNRDRFIAGDTAEFELKLDPAAAAFLGGYNIKEIVLIRTANGQREVARVPATNGQTSFNFTFIAPDAGLTNEFTAFAVTRLVPVNLLSLELDTARPTNTAPVAVDDRAAVSQDTSATVIPVLTNDTDADSDALQVSAVTQPTQGTAAVSADAKAVSYRPARGFVGSETFRYTVIDGKGGSAQATVTVETKPLATAVARLEEVSLSARVFTASCRGAPCDRSENERDEQDASQVDTRSTGFRSSGQFSLTSNTTSPFGQSADAAGAASFSFDRSDGTFSQVDLNCSSSNSISRPAENSLDANDSSSGGSVVAEFVVEGSVPLRYAVTILGNSVSAAGISTGNRRSGASVAGLLTILFNFDNDTTPAGSRMSGEPTGLIQPGSYIIRLGCGSGTPSQTTAGSASSTGGLRLTLQP